MQIAHAIQSVGFLTQIRESAIVYPVIMTTHLACIAVFGGMILMTDLRLLGIAMKDRTITEVVGGLRVWKRLGFCIMITMGLLLATSEAEKYQPNPYFWAKMTLLGLVGVHALIFRPLVYNRTEELDKAKTIPTVAKTAAVLSLVLWIGIVTMGRLIGYWEPKDNPFAKTTPAAQSVK
jgi:uncharacterized membrane protein